MRSSARVPATVALVVLVILWGIAHQHPVVRPLVERVAILTVAGALLAALITAGVRSYPEPAISDLDRPARPARQPEVVSRQRRRIVDPAGRRTATRSAGVPDVAARALIHRIGRERLRDRGLDPDDPGLADAARALSGPDLWTLLSTAPDRPVPRIDLEAALDRLEAL